MTDIDIKRSKQIYWASGIVSICGIIFEVLFGALGSYLLGDGVKQYTLTISLFLTGMGIGAFISERVIKNIIRTFVIIEFAVAVIGGFSAFLMFGIAAYLSTSAEMIYLYLAIISVGLLTGLELPLLIRKANEIGVTLNRSTARVLFSDYAGGLIGGLLFAFWLRPVFGLVKTPFLVAIVNLITALWMLYVFRDEIRHRAVLGVIGAVIGLALILGTLFGDEAAFMFEQKMYRDPIIYSQETKYQRIVMTKEQGDLRLYLDGNLQFSSADEYRYHETLVHPAVSLAEHPKQALILGGGDGLAARELLKYPFLQKITLVDLDPAMTHLARTNQLLTSINKGSLSDSRVHVINKDAFKYLEETSKQYDVIIVDLPDPNNISLNKVYTQEFYKLVGEHLTPEGAINIQATSPMFATKVYWTINKTVESAGLYTANMHVDVPSFGDWGFVLAGHRPISVDEINLRHVRTEYLTTDILHTLDTFGKDTDKKMTDDKGRRVHLKPNTLVHPDLIEMYQKAWLYY